MSDSANDYRVIARPLRLVNFNMFSISLFFFIFVWLVPADKILLRSLVNRSFASETSTGSATRLSFQIIAKGVHSGIHESLKTAIRNDSEWRALWMKHASALSSAPPPPTVNFDEELVVVIFLGDKPTGGYSVEIGSAERSDGVLTVIYDERSPRTGGMTIQAFTQPFEIIRIAVTGINKVTFRRLS
jgi:PrcB C-terminal